MLKYLLEPYPLLRNWKTDLLYTLGTGLFVGWFLVTFQPNDTNAWEHPYKYPFLWGYGGVVLLVLLVMRFVLPRLLPSLFRELNWTVAKQILYLLVSFLVAVIACYQYYNWFMSFPFKWQDFLYFTTVCSTIGVFPLSAYVVLNYIRQLKKYQTGAQLHNAQSRAKTALQKTQELLRLKDENGKVQLELPAGQIYYLQSALNYVEVFYQTDTQLRKDLIRISLKAVEAQLPQPPFLRSHRSYIVNVDQVSHVSGNAQGYKLHLKEQELLVPVSRGQSKQVLAQLN